MKGGGGEFGWGFFCNAYFSKMSKISLIQIVTAWQTWNLKMLNQVLVEVRRGVWNSVTGCSYPERFALEMLNIVFYNVPIINIVHGTLYAAALCVCGVRGFFCKALQLLSSCSFESATIFMSSSPTKLKDSWQFVSHRLFQAQVYLMINWESKPNRGWVKRGGGAGQLSAGQIWNKGLSRERSLQTLAPFA